jgi:hypothetical protein
MTVRGVGSNPVYFPYHLDKIERLRALLGEHDSRLLEAEAEKWGIEIPTNEDKSDWYKTKDPYPDSITGDTTYTVVEYLNDKGRTMIGKQVRDAKFAYWKGWADVLIPILALIVAGLALFKDIIVEAIKRP